MSELLRRSGENKKVTTRDFLKLLGVTGLASIAAYLEFKKQDQGIEIAHEPIEVVDKTAYSISLRNRYVIFNIRDYLEEWGYKRTIYTGTKCRVVFDKSCRDYNEDLEETGNFPVANVQEASDGIYEGKVQVDFWLNYWLRQPESSSVLVSKKEIIRSIEQSLSGDLLEIVLLANFIPVDDARVAKYLYIDDMYRLRQSKGPSFEPPNLVTIGAPIFWK